MERPSTVPFPAMAAWLAAGNEVEDFPVDSEREVPWPPEMAAQMEALRTQDLDVDEDFWKAHQ